MNILGRWSVVSFINFLVQLAWALGLVALCLIPLTLILGFFGSSFVLIELPINLDIATDAVTSGPEWVILTESVGASYFPLPEEKEGINWPIITINIVQMAGLVIILYSLSQLKQILRNLMNERPFTSENHSNLQVIAIIVMLISPFLYGYHWLSYWYFESFYPGQTFEAAPPTFEISYIIWGLVILVLAEIFRQATYIHEEQQLTV